MSQLRQELLCTNYKQKNSSKAEVFMVGSEGFEPPKTESSDLQSDAFGHFANYPSFAFKRGRV